VGPEGATPLGDLEYAASGVLTEDTTLGMRVPPTVMGLLELGVEVWHDDCALANGGASLRLTWSRRDTRTQSRP
jgi:hypothetical protein